MGSPRARAEPARGARAKPMAYRGKGTCGVWYRGRLLVPMGGVHVKAWAIRQVYGSPHSTTPALVAPARACGHGTIPTSSLRCDSVGTQRPFIFWMAPSQRHARCHGRPATIPVVPNQPAMPRPRMVQVARRVEAHPAPLGRFQDGGTQLRSCAASASVCRGEQARRRELTRLAPM